MDELELTKVIEEMIKESPKRKFVESVDIAINLRDINLKDPSKRFQVDIKLPHKLSKEAKICVIAEGSHFVDAQAIDGVKVLSKNDLDLLAREQKSAKKHAEEYDFFLASAPIMPIIGRSLGKFLGPRGKMAKPIPPNASITPLIEGFRNTIQIRVRQSPVIQSRFGFVDMSPHELAENALSVIRTVEGKLERGENNIRSIYIKTTMGPARKISK